MSERTATIFVEQHSRSLLDGSCSDAVSAYRRHHLDRYHYGHGAIRQSSERCNPDFLSDLRDDAYLETIDVMDRRK